MKKDTEGSEKHIKTLHKSFSGELEDPEVKTFLKMIEEEKSKLLEEAQADPRISELTDKLNKNPGDKEALFQLAELQWKASMHEDAIDNLLNVPLTYHLLEDALQPITSF
jgi:thioredoxin-like negative regulator of GroEL